MRERDANAASADRLVSSAFAFESRCGSCLDNGTLAFPTLPNSASPECHPLGSRAQAWLNRADVMAALHVDFSKTVELRVADALLPLGRQILRLSEASLHARA